MKLERPGSEISSDGRFLSYSERDHALGPTEPGVEYCRLYRLCKLGELERFEKSISPREYDWYLLAD